MLYVYHGDPLEARAKVRVTIESLLKKNPDALSMRITEENFAEFSLLELVTAQALFKNEYIVLLDNLLVEEETKDRVLEFIKEIGKSANIFFLLEEKIDAKALKKLEKYANKIKRVVPRDSLKRSAATGKGVSWDTRSTFALADALGEGNKKKLWQLFWAAKYAGISDEEIQGVLFWIAKAMFLARRAPSTSSGQAAGTGLKPFVFSKAKRFADKKSEKQLHDILNTLVRLPHESRRSSTPLAISLEQFILLYEH